MADVRINGRRIPILQAIDTAGVLIQRLESIGSRNNTELTSLTINGRAVDLDQSHTARLRLDRDDTVEARMESHEQMAFESLQVAQEMAELLVFDLKVATLHLWDNSRYQDKSLETLLTDCSLFLSLGARPLDLLGKSPDDLPPVAQDCLKQLDAVANSVEDATLLAVSGNGKDACHLLVGRVMPAIERWLGLTVPFAEHLQIDKVQLPVVSPESLSAHR